MKLQIVFVAAATLFASAANAQVTSHEAAAGVWRGKSTCLVHPSPCNDEVTVYRITETRPDSVSVDAFKIVDGKELEMGLLTCGFVPASGQIACAFARGTWMFTVHGDNMSGELLLKDGTKFRVVTAKRSH